MTGETTTTTTTAPAPWFEGADSDTLGYLQNRGWDKVDAKEAALGAIKAHREAEKHLGVPSNQIVRIPKDASDTQGWTDLRSKLGVPADEKGYDFSAVKFKDGSTVDAGFAETLGKALLEANVSKERAAGVAQNLVKFMESNDEAALAETTAKLVQEKQTLAANWGNHFQANMILAQRAFSALGGEGKAGEIIAVLEKQVGYAAVMDFMRGIGMNMKEDPFVTSVMRSNGDGPMTADQARATLNDRMHDAQWCQKLEAGDMAARREFDNLTRMMQPAR